LWKKKSNEEAMDSDNEGSKMGFKSMLASQMNPLTSALLKAYNTLNNEEEENNCVNSDDDIDESFDINTTKEDMECYEEDFVELDVKIKTIDDLIELCKKFDLFDKKKDKTDEDEKEQTDKDNKNEHEHGVNVFFDPTSRTLHLLSSKAEKDNKEENENDDDSLVEYNEEKELYKYDGKYYSINPKKLHDLVKPLTKLKNMIGISKIKDSIINFITHYLQKKENKKMLHTVIEGPPGVGKTKLGKILAEVYAALGVIPSARFKLVTRSDLIGQFAGETDKKTQAVLDDADGGVLFIDEAYAIGSEGKDTYSRECINCINQNLSEKKKKLIIIMAGYKDALEKYVFSKNEGLKRRFPFRYVIDGYSPSELKDIFRHRIRQSRLKLHYKVTDTDLVKLFGQDGDNKLKNFGGDIENIVTHCEMINDRDNFGSHPKLRKILTLKTIKRGFEEYKSHLNESRDDAWKSLYL
jgi:ATP-dependent Clp protease ATP-binding subunit ClpA